MKWLVAISVSLVMVCAAHAAADVEAGKAKVRRYAPHATAAVA